MKKNFLKTGVIGMGIGNLHAKIMNKHPKSKLIYVCDKKKNFSFLAKKFGCKFSTNANNLIKDKSIDLVSIASYDNHHFQHAIKCIAKNKHIFIEKPFCQSFSQYKKIKRLLNKSKLYFSTNFVLRNHPKFKKIKEIIEKKRIGKIYHIEGDYNYGRIHKLLNGWRGKIPFYSVTQGGGIHIIDLMIWLTKSLPKDVFALGNRISTLNTKFKYMDNVTGLINFENGVTGKVSSNFGAVMPHDHQMRIFGTKGSVSLSHNEISLFISRLPYKKKIKIKFKNDNFYKVKILDNFINSITAKKKFNLISKHEVFASMATCLTIDKSLKSKKREKVKI
jgi:predicted dehydrogenase